MHEFGITSRIVATALNAAQANGATRVARLDLLIGQLTFLDPDQVRFAYGILTRRTILEGSELCITQSPGLVECQECHFQKTVEIACDPATSPFSPAIPLLSCSRCGGKGIIIRGKECRVDGIVIA
jgi:hydrogenase nickel incorporation protein HypA/HybF